MQKKLRNVIILFITVIFISAASGCSVQSSSNVKLVGVKVAAADKHKIQSNSNVTGVLVPAQTVNIVSKISGQVTGLSLEVGSNVKAGDTVITIETQTLKAQLEQANATLKSAQAAVQSTQNQAEQARINLDAASKAYERTKSLYDSNVVSQSELEAAQSKVDIAKKQYELYSGPSQNQAKAQVSSSMANINNIKIQLDNAVIKSPISGVVTNKNINAGELAAAGAALLTIADTSTLKLKGTVPQEQLPLLKVGQDIDVSVDIYPDKVLKGKIASIGPIAVSTGKYFPIEISLKNPGDIMAGLSAHAVITMDSENGVVVPSSAVVQNSGQSYVYVIKDNIASKRIVTLGLVNDNESEITKGLETGEQVAVTNVNSLFDNMPVKVN